MTACFNTRRVRWLRPFFWSVLILGSVIPAQAAHQLVVDPEKTDVTFLLGATGHDVEGTLFLREGVLDLDPEQGTATGTLAIDAMRTVTGNTRRDKTMHKKVLHSEEHPLILFRAERLSGEWGGGEIVIEGTVEIDGSVHPLSLPTQLEIDGETWQATVAFTVPYVEWGMHDPSLLFLKVAKVVEVTVNAAGSHAVTADASAGEGR